jgi:hypothetical protein
MLIVSKVQTAYKTTPLRWQVADSQRMFQDEYLEWSVQRDPSTQQIRSVTYTCEGPEVSIVAYFMAIPLTDRESTGASLPVSSPMTSSRR